MVPEGMGLGMVSEKEYIKLKRREKKSSAEAAEIL